MPISDASREGLAAARASDPWGEHQGTDRITFRRAVQSGLLPAAAAASDEFRWIAVQLVMNMREVPYDTAPSMGAAAWLRRMRWRSGKALKERFWEESWPFYMDSRLSLELKVSAPPVPKRRAAKSEGVDLARSSIDGFLKKDGENGKAVDAGS